MARAVAKVKDYKVILNERSVSMAQRVQVILEDDLDGGDASETVTFALDGVTYEIDLNDANAVTLREALAGYIDAGRRVGRRRAGNSPKPHRASNRGELAKIRDWARSAGHEVADRGRISQEIRDAYAKANG